MSQDSWWANHWLKLVLVAISIVIIVPVITNYWLAPMIFEQNRKAGENIAKDTINAEKAVQEYEEFRTLWYDIKSAREQLENYRQQEEQFHETYGDDPSEWSRTAETRHGRIHDRITGQQNQVSRLVAEYNAKQDTATEAIFQCGLPYSIDEKLYIGDATGVEYTSQEAMDKTPPEDPSECKFAQDPAASGASNSTN
jgi:hypothetical protein